MASIDIASEWRQCVLVLLLCKSQWDGFVEQKKVLSEDEIREINMGFIDCQNFINNRQESLLSLVEYYEIYARLNKSLVKSAEKMGLNVRMINADQVACAVSRN